MGPLAYNLVYINIYHKQCRSPSHTRTHNNTHYNPSSCPQAIGSAAADVTAETMQRLEKMSLDKVQEVTDATQPSVDTATGQSLALDSLFGSESSKKPETIDKATSAVVANPQARLDGIRGCNSFLSPNKL